MITKEFKVSIDQLVKKRRRVTNEVKDNANKYAWEKLDEDLIFYVNSTEEVDLMLECVEHIKNSRYSYHRAKVIAPHNLEVNLKK